MSSVEQRLDRIETTLKTILDRLSPPTSKASSEQPKEQPQTGFTEEELNQVEWQDNDWGQWTFARNRDGTPSGDPIVRRLAEHLKIGSLKAFGFEYKLSGNEKQFINRRRK